MPPKQSITTIPITATSPQTFPQDAIPSVQDLTPQTQSGIIKAQSAERAFIEDILAGSVNTSAVLQVKVISSKPNAFFVSDESGFAIVVHTKGELQAIHGISIYLATDITFNTQTSIPIIRCGPASRMTKLHVPPPAPEPQPLQLLRLKSQQTLPIVLVDITPRQSDAGINGDSVTCLIADKSGTAVLTIFGPVNLMQLTSTKIFILNTKVKSMGPERFWVQLDLGNNGFIFCTSTETETSNFQLPRIDQPPQVHLQTRSQLLALAKDTIVCIQRASVKSIRPFFPRTTKESPTQREFQKITFTLEDLMEIELTIFKTGQFLPKACISFAAENLRINDYDNIRSLNTTDTSEIRALTNSVDAPPSPSMTTKRPRAVAEEGEEL